MVLGIQQWVNPDSAYQAVDLVKVLVSATARSPLLAKMSTLEG